MTSRPPPLPKKEENNRETILDRVEKGWLEEDWSSTMPRLLLNDLLQEKFISASKPTSNRVSFANEEVQWIRMEELGKALTNRCREEGVAFFLDKIEETIHKCDNLLQTWKAHGTPLEIGRASCRERV